MINGIIDSGQKIVTNGLVLHLDAAQLRSYPGSGTTWTDLSRLGNNGTLINGPTFNSGNGGSIVLDSINDYVNVPFSSNFPTGSGARTMSSWFRVTSVTGGRELLGMGGNSFNGQRSALWIDANSTIGVECAGNTVLTSDWAGINNWVNLTATYNAGGNVHSFLIYVNGTQRTTTTSGSAVALNSSNSAFLIGTVPTAIGAHLFPGNISTVYIYNRSLSATEVLQNYNATKSRFGL
jgi:hypothetical protein